MSHYFNQVKALAEPSATRLVRDVTGQLTMGDNNEDILYLLSHMSKRGVYRQYCEHRGKRVVTSNDGQTTLEDMEGRDQKDTISWSTFFNYWNGHFSHLRVSQPHEDICKECYVFANRQRYVTADSSCVIIDDDDLSNMSISDDSSTDHNEGDAEERKQNPQRC